VNDMMQRYFSELKKLVSEYKPGRIADAIFAGFLFSTIIFVPVYLILTELMIVYVYLYYEITALFILAALGHMAIWHLLTKQSLARKIPNSGCDLNFLFFSSMLFFGLVIIVIGLLIIFVMLPIWMV